MTRANADIRVLVVDDSAVIRQAVTGLLSAAGGFTVTPAADPLIAMLHMKSHRPDVILLDLEMPRMDGLTFLRQIMATDPIPVVILSSFLGASADLSVRALEEGAVEIVTKPKVGARAFFEESMNALVGVLSAAATARPRRPARPGSRVAPRDGTPAPGRLTNAASHDDVVVVIGASTGGTDALRTIFAALPGDAPGIVAVQHMPARFTAAFADRLASECRMDVKEAEDGDVIRAGCALIAPGGRHSSVRRRLDGFVVRLSDDEPVCQHRPSVDVLFRSAATAAGPRAVGVLLTGMGSDGADGMSALHLAGAGTLAQDEASCVIFGMPRAAIQRGAVTAIVPLDLMHTAILEQAALAASGGAMGSRWVNDSAPPAFGGQYR